MSKDMEFTSYCPVCRKPNMLTLNIGGKERYMECKCDCDRLAEEKERERIEREEKERLVESLKRLSVLDGDSNNDKAVMINDLSVTESNIKQIEIAKRYANTFPERLKENNGLLFYGKVGTGKTYLARAIANEVIENGYSALITRFGIILDAKKDFSKPHPELDRMNNVDLLVLDDLGVENETPFAKSTMFEIIDARYRSKKPVIITTNLPISEIKNPADTEHKRMYDRILEMCIPIPFNGASWRMSKAVDNYNKFHKE